MQPTSLKNELFSWFSMTFSKLLIGTIRHFLLIQKLMMKIRLTSKVLKPLCTSLNRFMIENNISKLLFFLYDSQFQQQNSRRRSLKHPVYLWSPKLGFPLLAPLLGTLLASDQFSRTDKSPSSSWSDELVHLTATSTSSVQNYNRKYANVPDQTPDFAFTVRKLPVACCLSFPAN